MRPAWRLSTSALSARPSRTVLLSLAVALSAALIAAVACAMASANASLRAQVESQLGTGEARLRAAGTGETFDAALAERVAALPGVERVTPRLSGELAIIYRGEGLAPAKDGGDGFVRTPLLASTGVLAIGTDLDREATDRGLTLVAGRLPSGPGEIAIDAMTAERLSWSFARSGEFLAGIALTGKLAEHLQTEPIDVPESTADASEADRINAAQGVRPGDTVEVRRGGLLNRFREGTDVTVVGIVKPPPLGGRPQAYMPIDTLGMLTDKPDQLSEIEIDLASDVDPEAWVETHRDALPETTLLATTERITSGLEKNMASSQLGFVLASVLSFLSAAFIIMTGLTTGVAEQQRALAVLRCIGARRRQLGQAQLLLGLMVGVAGAAVGVPLGIGIAAAIVWYFRDQVPGGLAIPPVSIAVASVGSVIAGLFGAAWPAWQAARLPPLKALAARAMPATSRGVAIATAFGLGCLGLMIVIVGLPANGQFVFWGYATVGLPAMFVGYFLLGVPLTMLLAATLGPVLTRAMRLPPAVLRRSIAGTPYRHGFTAGAMMSGLGLMIAIWTNGTSMMRDWIGRIEFPDAFVSGLALDQETIDIVRDLDFVEGVSSIGLQPVETDAFGVHALQRYRTTFVGFEPEPFFKMTTLVFEEGDPAEAERRLIEGGAVIVAREFRVAKGLGAGDTFVCRHDGKEYEFEIVGVVTSPGLELVSKFFNVGAEVVDQSLHAVFGSRDDMIELFGNDKVQMIQMDLADDISDEDAIIRVREALVGQPVLDVGSGRKIKQQIVGFLAGSLVIFTTVGIGSMVVAGLGVANLIIAAIEGRKYEFGVLRAVGGARSLLTRLVLCEALIVGVSAGIIGTAIGLQGAWAGRRLYGMLLGIELTGRVPWTAVLIGWSFVLGIALLASAPAVLRLNRLGPRELLASVRG